MTPLQKRGRIYVVSAIAVVVLVGLAIKAALFSSKGFSRSHAFSTAVTVITCGLLWRGSHVAYSFMFVAAAIAAVFILMAARWFPNVLWLLTVPATFCGVLIAPGTKSFLLNQRGGTATDSGDI